MKSERLGQAVICFVLVGLVTSCTASKEYSSKLFNPRIPVVKDSQVVVLKFLNIDSSEQTGANWVSTDFIMGRDTLHNSEALDKLALVLPPAQSSSKITDSLDQSQQKTIPTILANKPAPVEGHPVAKYLNQGEVRSKRSRE